MATAQTYENPDEIVAKVREGLSKLEKRKTATTKALVQTMAGDVKKAMASGSTLADVLEVLNASGLEIKASTLRLYLSHAEEKTKTPKASRSKTPSKPSEEVTPAAAAASPVSPTPATPATDKTGSFAIKPDTDL